MSAPSRVQITDLSTAQATSLSRGPEPIRASSLRASPFGVPDWTRRIPALDGLRGIAILLVLLRHFVFGFSANSAFFFSLQRIGQLWWSGVDLFFVLSGFLIGGILLDARKSSSYFKTFYFRRFYRIFPLYFAVTGLFLVSYLLYHLLLRRPTDLSSLSIPWLAYATFTQNFWMAKLGEYGTSALAVTWSLAVEEQFYLTIPLLIRKIHPARLAFVMLAAIIAAPLVRFALTRSLANGNFACYVLMPCRADALCMGVLAAYLVRQSDFWNLLLTKRAILQAVTAILFAGVVFMTYRQWHQFSSPMVTVGFSWLAAFYTCCLLLAVSHRSDAGGQRFVLCNPGLMKLGTLAYCTYLIHWPLLTVAHRAARTFFPDSRNAVWLAAGLLAMAATVAIASLSWQYFEKPMLRRGHEYKY